MKLLILKEKHENEYWLVEDPKDLGEVCLIITRRRLEEGYWYSDNDSHLKMAQDAVKNQDGPMAYNLMRHRQSHEYEGWELRNLKSARGFSHNDSHGTKTLIATRREAEAIRLAAEVNAARGDDSAMLKDMALSMDLEVQDVERLFEINENRWEAIKKTEIISEFE